MPNPRVISPAREDFEGSSPAELLVWPFVWCAVALLLLLGARAFRTPIGAHDAEHHAAERHPGDGRSGPAHPAEEHGR